MGEVFSSSGEKTDNVVVPTPRLQGLFIPGIDNPAAIDGFGTVVPWGGGSTTRRYADYGISVGRDTQLNDLASSFVPAEGIGATYNFEGLVGPQGPPGRDGVDGITHLVVAPNTSFQSALPYTLNALDSLGTAADKMIYTSAYTTTVNFVWTNSPIASAVKSWNEAAINDDASFLIIAADAGIYISTDTGASWRKDNPDGDTYIQAACADSGGKAIVLGNTNRASGTLWTTDDYGVNWTEKTVTKLEGSATTKESQSSSTANNQITASTFWVAQTWLTTSAYSMTGVKLYLSRMGVFVGNVVVSLRATDVVTGKPTGGDLASVTFDGSTLTTSSSGDGITRNFDTPYSVSSGTTYAFVLRHTGIGYQAMQYRRHGTNPYADGALHVSSDSGNTWGDASTSDVKFYTYGKGSEPVDTDSIRLGSAGDFILATGENGVYLSADLGATWTTKDPDVSGTTDWTKGICSSDGTYIIVVSDANAIYRSANSGTAWAQITPAGGDTFTVNDLAISDDGQFAVIVGQNSTDATKSCYISTDYGVNWTSKKPIASSIEWTNCSISNDGSIIAVSATGYFYISLDSGTTWLAQGLSATAEVWDCLAMSGDTNYGIVANTNDNDEVFIGLKTNLYSRETWAEADLTAAGRALLDDANAAAQATTLGLGTGDNVIHNTLTLSSIAAESTDVDKFLVDSTGIVKYRTGTQVLSDIGASASSHVHDGVTLQHDGVNSDGGAFGFNTTGLVTFNQSIASSGLITTGKLTAGSFGSPIDVTNTRQYGFEIHYSGNDYDVTGIRSRAQLVTTDTSATAQGVLLQAANNDGINAGVLQGALIEAIGKSTGNAATISTMRGCLINAEWGALDTVTALNTLHVRTHSLNSAGAGSFGTGYGIYIENEAVGGNGQALDAGIYFKGTNLSGGNKAFTYGMDFTGATYGTADIKITEGGTIGGSGADLRVNSNNQVIINKTSATYPFLINSSDGSDQVKIYHDNANFYTKWNDGDWNIQTDEGTNSDTKVRIRGKGTGSGYIYVYDEVNYGYFNQISTTTYFTAVSGAFNLQSTAGKTVLQQGAADDITMFRGATEGEIKELEIWGYRTGDASRGLMIGVGVDAADTASFDGLSNYWFDGAVDAQTLFKVAGTQVVTTQQAHIIDADGTLADITTKFNTLLNQLETHGLNASS